MEYPGLCLELADDDAMDLWAHVVDPDGSQFERNRWWTHAVGNVTGEETNDETIFAIVTVFMGISMAGVGRSFVPHGLVALAWQVKSDHPCG